ncbi:HAD family hydrolase [Actinomadura sp. 9N407]|uniref:HAD family hydrolase n=1 Tax=Actinomadura sp. 9N407 TaxID=3375154 RepID=UPI0037A83BB7
MGGPITCVALDYGDTLGTGTFDPDLGMRLITPAAQGVVLELVKDLGLRLLVASNTRPDQDRRLALGRARLSSRFAEVLQSHELAAAKPSRDFFDLVLNRAGCARHELLVVGNSLPHDVLPAIELGMPAVLVGPKPRRGLPPGATRLPDLTELPQLLKGRRL